MTDFRHNDAINHYVSLIGYCRNRCRECIFEPPQDAPCPVKLLEENYRLSTLFRRARELDEQALTEESQQDPDKNQLTVK